MLASRYLVNSLLLFSLLYGQLQAGAYSQLIAQKEQFGSFDCLPKNASAEDKQNTSCELSAAIYLGDGRLLLANDQPMPPSADSAIIWVDVPASSERHIPPKSYVRQPAVAQAKKFEEMTMTDKGTLIAMTGHDRYLDTSASLDAYCELLSWDWRHPGAVMVISALNLAGEMVPVRKAMAQAMKEEGQEPISYLKVEGLCALPNQRLLFGVREMGQDYANCSDEIRFLEIGYQEPSVGVIQLVGPFKQLYHLSLEQQRKVMHAYPAASDYDITGVSSLLYDTKGQRLLFMTTHEGPGALLANGVETKSIVGYLWWLHLEELQQGLPARPVLDEKGNPLCLKGHKPEGMSFLADHRLFIICDEDRVLSPMNPGEPLRDRTESPYFIYKLQEAN